MPLLSDSQLAEIRQLIEDYHTAFFINVTGNFSVVEKTVRERLIRLGLISPTTQTMPKDALMFGLMVEQIERKLKEDGAPKETVDHIRKRLKEMSYDEFKHVVKKRVAEPLTSNEQAAVKHVQRSVYTHLKGLGNTVDKKTNEVLIEGDQKLRRVLESTVQQKLIEGIESRKTIKQIGSMLGQATGQHARDWYRISVTETNNAFSEGLVQNIIKKNEGKSHDEIEVYKRPSPGACPECVKAYLEADGVTPRLFKLSELTSSGTNVGRNRATRLPVVGSHHPWCRCQLYELTPGNGFDKEGNEIYVGSDK